MTSIAQIRRDYPQYHDLSDKQIADALHARYYKDVPLGTFYQRVGLAAPDADSDSLLDTAWSGVKSGTAALMQDVGSLGTRYLGGDLGLGEAGQSLERSTEARRSVADRAMQAAQADRERAAATATPGLLARGVAATGSAMRDALDAMPESVKRGVGPVASIASLLSAVTPDTPEEAAVQGAQMTAPLQSGRAAVDFAARQVPSTAAALLPGGVASKLGLEGVAASRVALGTNAALNSASAARQASDIVRERGGTPEQARAAYDKALAVALATSAAAARMPSLEKQMFAEPAVKGSIAKRAAVGAGKAAIAEAPQEFVEEAGAQLGTNVGTGDPLSKDVLSSGALGALGGVGAGATLGGAHAAISGEAAPETAQPVAPETAQPVAPEDTVIVPPAPEETPVDAPVVEPQAEVVAPVEEPVAAGVVEPPVPEVGEAPVEPGTFRTAKGSTYTLHDDGTTSRDKAFRPEHGEAEQGPQPRSENTFFVSPDDALKLAEFQAQGGPKTAIQPLGDGRFGLRYLKGKDEGKFETRTVVTPLAAPEVGATPVETWKDGTRVHFGNPITSIAQADEAPVPTLTAPIGDGTSKAPVVATTPEHVELAAAQVAEPTDAQKESGTYRKGHVKIQGLDIAIENPKGSERSGTDTNGEPWSVTMPDHYGYVKRTEGADGDAVDVYIGPDPRAPTVFVVDQADADTGAWDEHKAMLGYGSETEALDAYNAAFSDGRGPDRTKAVTPMAMDDFKTWLKRGDTSAPAADSGVPPVDPPGTDLVPVPPAPSEPPAPPARAVPKWLAELDRRFGYMYRDAPGFAQRLGAAFPVKRLASLASRATGRQTTLNHNYIEPMLRQMEEAAKQGVDPQDIDAYLWARAAPGRNASIAARNPEVLDGSGMTDEDAAGMLADLANQGKIAALRKVAAQYDRLAKAMQAERVRGGTASQEAVDAMAEREPFYASLKGWTEPDVTEDQTPAQRAEAEKRMAQNRRKVTGVTPREFTRARGRASMPFSPVANLVSDAQAAEARVERNLTTLPFLDMVLADPEGFADIAKVYNAKKPFLKEGADGKLKPVDLAANADQFMVVMKNGEPNYIRFQPSEEGEMLKRMFDNLSPQQLGPVLQALTRTRQFFTSMMTRFNPYYPVRAVLRDSMDAVVSAYAAESMPGGPAQGKKVARQMMHYMRPGTGTWRAVGGYLRGSEPRNAAEAEAHAMLDQMINDGGAVGHAMVMNAEQFAKSAAARFEKLKAGLAKSPATYAKDAVHTVAQGLDDINQVIDLVPRLATYRAALDAGLNREDAAGLALASSLDLTRRGEWSRMADLWYYFFNPRVQSVIKQAQMIKSPNGRKALAGFVAAGFMSGMWNAMMMGGDDDDDGRSNFESIPTYQQYSGLIFAYGPGANDYVYLPVGFVVAFPSFLGQKIAAVTSGLASPEQAATSMAEHLAETSKAIVANYLPVSAQMGSADDATASLIPSMAAPAVQGWRNENFFGTSIYNKAEDGQVPSELGREGTGAGYKAAAKALNFVTGGDENFPGWASVQPEVIRHFVNGLTGSAFKPVADAANLGDKLSHGESVAPKDVPFVNVFAGKGGEYRAMNDYFAAKEVMTPIAKLDRDGELTDAVRAQKPVETQPAIIDAFNEAETERRALGKDKREALDGVEDAAQRRAVLQRYEKDRNAIYARFMKEYNAARRRD